MMHLRRLLPILACAAAACPKNVQRAQPDAGLPEVDAGAQVGAPDAGYDAGPQPLVGIAAPATAYFGDPVTVDAVVPADLTVDTYFFLFGDGSGVVEQTSPHASHVYRSAGTFHILLTVRDASRSFLSASATI